MNHDVRLLIVMIHQVTILYELSTLENIESVPKSAGEFDLWVRS